MTSEMFLDFGDDNQHLSPKEIMKSAIEYFGGAELAFNVWQNNYVLRRDDVDAYLCRSGKKQYKMKTKGGGHRIVGWSKSPDVEIREVDENGVTKPTEMPTASRKGKKHYMSKFALYHLQFTWDKQRDVFGPDDWERREELFRGLLEKDDSMEFTIGEKHYKHKLYHCKANKNVIVMRFANDKDLLIEQDFKEKTVKHNPSCFVVFDNRAGSRRVIIQKLQSSFNSTFQVARILQNNISQTLTMGNSIGVTFHPQRYTQNFYKLWDEHPDNTEKLRFNISDSVSEAELANANTVCGVMQIVENRSRASEYATTVEVRPTLGNKILPVDKTSDYIKGLVQYSATTGCSIELVTTDGAIFKCFIDSDIESNDKIVSYDMDAGYMEQLFDSQVDEKDKAVAEEKIIEFLNGMKYLVDENEVEVR